MLFSFLGQASISNGRLIFQEYVGSFLRCISGLNHDFTSLIDILGDNNAVLLRLDATHLVSCIFGIVEQVRFLR